MRTRTSTGTPIKLPSRYQQPDADDKGKSVPKAKAKRTARPKPKAKCLANSKRVRSTSSRCDPKNKSSASHTLNVDMKAFPYGPLSGLGLDSQPERKVFPSEESNYGISTRPLAAHVEDPIVDSFSDNCDAWSEGREIVALLPTSSSSSRGAPQKANEVHQELTVCITTNSGFSACRCSDTVAVNGSDQDEMLRY